MGDDPQDLADDRDAKATDPMAKSVGENGREPNVQDSSDISTPPAALPPTFFQTPLSDPDDVSPQILKHSTPLNPKPSQNGPDSSDHSTAPEIKSTLM